MVQSIDKLNVALYPGITKINKWVLAISTNKNNSNSIQILNATTISCIKDFQYVMTYEELFCSLYKNNQYDINYDEPNYKGTNNIYFRENTFLYAAHSKDEIFEFLRNVIEIHKLLIQ